MQINWNLHIRHRNDNMLIIIADWRRLMTIWNEQIITHQDAILLLLCTWIMKLVERKDVKEILNIISVLNEYTTFLNDLLKNEMNDQWKSLNKMIKKSNKVLLKIDDYENNNDIESTWKQMNISETWVVLLIIITLRSVNHSQLKWIDNRRLN